MSGTHQVARGRSLSPTPSPTPAPTPTRTLDAPASVLGCSRGHDVDFEDLTHAKDQDGSPSSSTSIDVAKRLRLLWPQRFEDSALEKDFVNRRLVFARRTTRFACGVFLVFFVLLGFCPPPTASSNDTKTTVLIVRCVMLVVGTFGPLAATRCGELGLCICWLPICCSPLVFSCFRVYWALGDKSLLVGTCGMTTLLSSEEYEESKSDSLLLILMLTTTTSFFHFTPIRCRVGWWLAVLPPVVYAAATFPLPSDGPECSLQRRARISVTFAASCGFALLGRAWNECSERHDFLRRRALKSEILSERILRYQAEHKVSLAELPSNRAQRSRSTRGQEVRSHPVEAEQPSNGLAAGAACRHNQQPGCDEGCDDEDANDEEGEDDANDDAEARSEGPPPSYTTTEYAFQSADQVQLIALGLQEHWVLNGMTFHIDSSKILGTGAFGKVYRGVFCGVKVAVKLVKEGRAQVDDALDGRSMLANEIRVLRRVRHPHIACFFGVYVAKSQEGLPTLALLLELVHGPSLQNLIEKEASVVSDVTRRHLLMDVASALWYLHELQPHVVHSDLKATNILVERHPGRAKAKLIDFGLSRVFSSRATMSGGTLSWIPPEFFHTPRPPPVPSFDVFSFGRLAFFIITAKPPCESILRPGELAKEEREALGRSTCRSWPADAASPALQAECRRLVEECLSYEPTERPSMATVHRALSKMSL